MQDQYKQAHDAINSAAIQQGFFMQPMGSDLGVIYVNEMRPEVLDELREALRRGAATACRQIVVVGEPTLSVVINRLTLEKNKVQGMLATLPASEWMSDNGRTLANREQELHTTLSVLGLLRTESMAEAAPAAAAVPDSSTVEG